MTASEVILSAWADLLSTLGTMSVPELLINVGLSCLFALAAVLAVKGIKRVVRYAARRLPGPPSAEKTVRASRVARLFAWLVRVGASATALVMIANVWGIDPLAWAARGAGEEAVAVLLRLGLLFMAAVVAFELAGLAIGHGVARMAARAAERGRRAQLNTLGPLLKGVAQTAILIVAALMALSELGVKIGPLLAGAGVVGIALGFGAQTLVKDFLTGVFLVVEDIVSVGDIVRIGDSGGLVEQMTLRTIRLRDFDGTLHVFPYSEAQVVHNLTKTFSYYVFDLQVSYGSDIDRALQIMRRVGDGMAGEAEFGDMILEPIEVVGVDNLADSGVILKARIKTRPLQQWTVGREYNRRIKLAFDREGIEIPFPHMKVVLPERQLSELARH